MTCVQAYPVGEPIRMAPSGPWPAAVHRFDARTVAALRAAEATGRPLLIRGLPGVGKSMTARAAAAHARRPLLAQVIDGRTETDDLKARFDAVRKLADAQVRREHDDELPPDRHYLTPGVLWWAFDWDGAADQWREALRAGRPSNRDARGAPVEVPDPWQARQDRAVLLLDEIDKADPELPNALLEAFSLNGFTVPVIGQEVRCPPQRRPLIVLTTNEERELPNAFLRRCLVLWLALPEVRAALVDELVAIGTDHQQWLMSGQVRQRAGACLVIREAAEAVAAARLAARDGGYVPGTSEFLDLVGALAELWPDDRDAQLAHLDELRDFALKKSGDDGD